MVQALDVLDGVARLTNLQAVGDDGLQIDKHTLKNCTTPLEVRRQKNGGWLKVRFESILGL